MKWVRVMEVFFFFFFFFFFCVVVVVVPVSASVRGGCTFSYLSFLFFSYKALYFLIEWCSTTAIHHFVYFFFFLLATHVPPFA